MEKKRLEIEALRVDSFETSARRPDPAPASQASWNTECRTTCYFPCPSHVI